MKLGYARKSKGEPESLEMQISRLTKAECDEILSDIKSGTTSDRVQWKKLIAFIESGKVTEIVVTRVDRLGRSLVSLCEVLKLIEQKKIKLTILDAPVGDPSSPFGWYSLTQMSLSAEFESRMMSNRVKHGMNHLRESKKSFKAAFGYERTKEGKLIPHQINWEIAKGIIDIYLEIGILRKSIAIAFEKFQIKMSVPGLRDWLRNPQLRGHTVYNIWHNRNNPSEWEVNENTHQALITEKEYQQIEFLMKRGRSMWGAKSNSSTAMKYPLAGQIYCGTCGGKCYKTVAGLTEPGARCRKRDEGIQFCTNKKSISLKKIENAVIEKMQKRSREVAQIINNSTNEEKVDPPKLQELRKQLSGLMTLGNNPAIAAAMDEVRSQILNEESRLNTSVSHSEEYLELIKVCEDQEYFQSETVQNLTILYRCFVEKVIISDGQIQEVVLKI
ncbi:MAG: fdxN element excision recombinase XisF [Rhizonema sp. NSF051]|nr:fdxN element excision recombinase XisF [Rhizonema sp. NSF051]